MLKKGNKKLQARGRIQDLYHPVAENLLVNNFVLLEIIKNNWYLQNLHYLQYKLRAIKNKVIINNKSFKTSSAIICQTASCDRLSLLITELQL